MSGEGGGGGAAPAGSRGARRREPPESAARWRRGRSVPSATLALRLARELGCRVEDLFWIDERHAPVRVELAADEVEPRREDSRVVLASLDGRWVAHRLAAGDPAAMMTAADGALAGGVARGGRAARVTPFADLDGAREHAAVRGLRAGGRNPGRARQRRARRQSRGLARPVERRGAGFACSRAARCTSRARTSMTRTRVTSTSPSSSAGCRGGPC